MPGTVTVACKLPAGLTLRLHGEQPNREPVMGGGYREGKIWRPIGEPITINGTAAQFGQQRRDAAGEFVQVVGGYALTQNVDKTFWDEWMKQSGSMHAVKNKLIFAYEKAESAVAASKEHSSLRHGLEPLVPTLTDGGGRLLQSDPRAPGKAVSQDDRKAA